MRASSVPSGILSQASDSGLACGLAGVVPSRTRAIVFEGAGRIDCRDLLLRAPASGDVLVETLWSGISTGTERMLWSGEMPPFPGMGYPLVPGYETVGRVVAASDSPDLLGRLVFVPGATCFAEASGLFGATASHLLVASERLCLLDDSAGPDSTLLALAATAHHAIARGGVPDLVVGNGVLGRLVARIAEAVSGTAPVVWETNPQRRAGTAAIDPSSDTHMKYQRPCDVSGNVEAIDRIIAHSARGAEVTLAGFYKHRPSFAFPPAFMKEISLHVAAEWRPENLRAVMDMVSDGVLRLDGLITHTARPDDAPGAYHTAFNDAACLKMIIDWGVAT